jgi:hypothetical protein
MIVIGKLENTVSGSINLAEILSSTEYDEDEEIEIPDYNNTSSINE